MLGSLTVYRRLLHENLFTERAFRTFVPPIIRPSEANIKQYSRELPALGHGIAGMMAGWTVSTIATPVEHVKARLQVQYSADKSKRLYSGPIDCVKKIVRVSLLRIAEYSGPLTTSSEAHAQPPTFRTPFSFPPTLHTPFIATPN